MVEQNKLKLGQLNLILLLNSNTSTIKTNKLSMEPTQITDFKGK